MKAKESSQPGRTHSTAIFISQNHSFFFHFRCVICYERRQRAFIVPLAVERVFRVLIVENIDPR